MTAAPLILVAEADAPTREALCIRLVESGFNVMPARDGHQAARLILDNPVAAAVLDMSIPGIDGIGLCEQVRECDPAAPVLLLTGSIRGARRSFMSKLAATLGAARCVPAPYDGRALAQHLRDILSRQHRMTVRDDAPLAISTRPAP